MVCTESTLKHCIAVKLDLEYALTAWLVYDEKQLNFVVTFKLLFIYVRSFKITANFVRKQSKTKKCKQESRNDLRIPITHNSRDFAYHHSFNDEEILSRLLFVSVFCIDWVSNGEMQVNAFKMRGTSEMKMRWPILLVVFFYARSYRTRVVSVVVYHLVTFLVLQPEFDMIESISLGSSILNFCL